MKSYPNILIVMGTGRNVGKTISACNIIQSLSRKHQTIGVKISPHFHELDPKLKYIHYSDELMIVEEKNFSKKDSSRMLQSGAKKVFYVQAKNEKLAETIQLISELIQQNQPVVIESGGLYNVIEPGFLFFVTGENAKKVIQIRKGTNVVKVNSGEVNYFEWDSIQFKNGKFTRYA